MPTGGEEVQLVAVVPVAAREGHQQRNERGADRNNRAGGERHEVMFDGTPIRLGDQGHVTECMAGAIPSICMPWITT
jgi:hypothetical protein